MHLSAQESHYPFANSCFLTNKWRRGHRSCEEADAWKCEWPTHAFHLFWHLLMQCWAKIHCSMQKKVPCCLLLFFLNNMLLNVCSVIWSILQASQKIVTVEQKLTRGWGGENAYHVSGYRYLLVDPDRRVSRASPSGKVTTLAKVYYCVLSKLQWVWSLSFLCHSFIWETYILTILIL